MSDFYVLLIQFLLFLMAVFMLSLLMFSIVNLAKNLYTFRRKRIKKEDVTEEN